MLQKLLQCLLKSMRSLIDHCSPGLILQFLQHCFSLFFIRREKCFKAESSGRLSGDHQRSHTGTGSRKCSHRHTCISAHTHKFLSRVGDAWHPCISDQGHILSFQHLAHQDPSLFYFVIFMITGHGSMDVKMIQKLDTVSRILRCDHIHPIQCPHHPVSHIFQITDGSCTQIQCSGLICHLTWIFLLFSPALAVPSALCPGNHVHGSDSFRPFPSCVLA